MKPEFKSPSDQPQLTIESTAELVEIYKELKTEISDFSKINVQLVIATITATGVILSVGFNSNVPVDLYIFFFTFLFIIPISNMVIGNRKNIWRISTYMRVFIEPNLHQIRWETRLHEQKRLIKKKDKWDVLLSKFVSSEILVFSLLSIVSCLSIVAMCYNHYSDGTIEDHLALGVTIVSCVILLIILVMNYRGNKSIARGGKIEAMYFESWEAVRDAE